MFCFFNNLSTIASSSSLSIISAYRNIEYGLPEYLQHDLDAYKEGLKNKSDLLDCLWGELYGSINIAEINDGAITREHAEFLRKKYLFGGKQKWMVPHTAVFLWYP